MRTLEALAEDLRRLGVALIIMGIVGAMIGDPFSRPAAVVAAAVGFALLGARYWMCSRGHDWQKR